MRTLQAILGAICYIHILGTGVVGVTNKLQTPGGGTF